MIMNRPRIEACIKLFIVALIFTFFYAVYRVMLQVGIVG